MLNSFAPFFVVDDLQMSLDFYRSKLGFEVLYTRDSPTTQPLPSRMGALGCLHSYACSRFAV
jgi:catechol 2,3-dioxygenase-like lactoylglutathione lyase family enzyme